MAAFKINHEVAEQAMARFNEGSANRYIENLNILKNKCKKYAEDSNTTGGQEALENAEALVRRAEGVYPKIFKDINTTILTISDASKKADTMH